MLSFVPCWDLEILKEAEISFVEALMILVLILCTSICLSSKNEKGRSWTILYFVIVCFNLHVIRKIENQTNSDHAVNHKRARY